MRVIRCRTRGPVLSVFLGTNTYTGTTYLNEGMFQDIIGSLNQQALGSGNLNITGSPNIQAVYENDNDFVRRGTGAGEVQLTGGGGWGAEVPVSVRMERRST